MDKIFNFSLESALIALTNSEDLRNLMDEKLPYLEKHKDGLNECLENGNCAQVEKLLTNIGEGFVESSHPPHLHREVPIKQTNQKLQSPSAFIPFCAFKGVLGIWEPKVNVLGISFPVCNQFLPITLDGQLCYHISVNMSDEDDGEKNGLT